MRIPNKKNPFGKIIKMSNKRKKYNGFTLWLKPQRMNNGKRKL